MNITIFSITKLNLVKIYPIIKSLDAPKLIDSNTNYEIKQKIY